MEKTLVIIKPDGVQRGLVGEIIGRLEQRGLRIVGLKMMQIAPELAEFTMPTRGERISSSPHQHITSAPVVVMILEGQRAIEVVRRLSATPPGRSVPGTIRGDWPVDEPESRSCIRITTTPQR